MVRIAFYQY